MTRMIWLCLVASCLTVASACEKSEEARDVEDDTGGANAPRGEEGESCNARADCEDGLSCISNRCIEFAAAADDEGDGGMATSAPDPGGADGESCTKRADCQTGLACFGNVCQDPDSPTLDGMPPMTRGDRGESCRARNDCGTGLACIGNRCVENDFDLNIETKQCFRVQCMEEADCCENFQPSAQCPTWQTQCDDGNANSCSIFRSNCQCQFTCREQICTRVTRCDMDTDCGFGGQLRCLDGTCTQCRAAGDCPDSDDLCIAGVCRSGCERNEQCPRFAECQAGECVDVGCSTDRECLFATNDPRSKCQGRECVSPCQNDAECGELRACVEERCEFVGCKTDEECRIFLNLFNAQDATRAICREPDE